MDIEARIAAIPAKHIELAYGRLTYRIQGSGFAVVLLHGIGSGAASWLLQFESLSKHYQVIAWDAPGYGYSDPLQKDEPSVWEYVEVLRAWLNALNINRYHLVAHSLGALIAGAHCQPDIRLPMSLTFIAPTLGYGALPFAERNQKITNRLQMFKQLGATGLAEKRGPGLLSSKASNEDLAIVQWNMSRLKACGYRQAIHLLGNTDLMAETGKITIPVLVICGTADQITQESSSQRLVEAYPHAAYMPIDGCGHVAYIEANNVVDEALAKHFTTSAG